METLIIDRAVRLSQYTDGAPARAAQVAWEVFGKVSGEYRRGLIDGESYRGAVGDVITQVCAARSGPVVEVITSPSAQRRGPAERWRVLRDLCKARAGVLALLVTAGVVLVGACLGGTDTPEVPAPGAVSVDISRLPSDDCWWEVGHRDTDGKPGGATVPRVMTRCP